jgi:hypothetical protein
VADEATQEVAPSESQESAPEAIATPSRTEAPEPYFDPDAVETWGVSEALSEGNDAGVLDALRREVTAFAEALYGTPDDRRPAVWDAVTASGWLAANRDAMGLAPLERFYELVKRYQVQRTFGASAEELHEMLTDNEFPALLMTLRELFIKAGMV